MELTVVDAGSDAAVAGHEEVARGSESIVVVDCSVETSTDFDSDVPRIIPMTKAAIPSGTTMARMSFTCDERADLIPTL
jgi:hypothetical protein